MPVPLRVDGVAVDIADESVTLLDALRALGHRSVKDGCSPQGQCGCCTVLVDGTPRVACVTPVRRVAGRTITTLDGLEDARLWADAFAATGASQCGFCTPGIIVRLAAAAAAGKSAPADVDQALLAHLCRCTGWQTIHEAASAIVGRAPLPALPVRDGAAARAALEGRTAQAVGPAVALGRGGFADDTAPDGALVAVPDGAGGWALGETLAEARRAAAKVQGRRTPVPLAHPVSFPDGAWDLRLRTTWIEPAYLEPDASWCVPGGEPASPLANGGAFGAKAHSVVTEAARRLADESGRPVKVVLAREDAVRLGSKRPPMAVGLNRDGRGIVRVVRTAGVAAAIASVAPDVVVEEVDVVGPPTSAAIRAAGWAELAVVQAGLAGRALVRSPEGAEAEAAIEDGALRIRVRCGPALDPVVLRSYCIGAAHMALGWVWSEGIALDEHGAPQDLTIRSFGILRARDMLPVDVEIDDGDGDGAVAVNGSDAVFAAVAAAAWIDEGLPEAWPTRRGTR